MKTPESYIKEIEQLREQHTKYFHAEEWLKMQAVGQKIRAAWDGFHRTVEREERTKV